MKDWKERFDEEFPDATVIYANDALREDFAYLGNRLKIKSFIQETIQTELDRQREETERRLMEDIEKVSPMIVRACNCCGGSIPNHWRGLHYEIAEIRHIIKPPSKEKI